MSFTRVTMINTPNRNEPTRFPPYGVLSIMSFLRGNGYSNIDFINVDHYRYTIEEVVDTIIENNTSIVGLSAVTSTSYSFVKELSLTIKKANPKVVIVLGGNMAAGAEIVLKKTGVDYCVLGEGELIFLNLVKAVEGSVKFYDIKGLAYLENGILVNTGYEESLRNNEIYDVDWKDLGDAIDHYIYNVFDINGNLSINQYKCDERTYEKHRIDKKHVDLIIGKGCVAKCTFCHRWDKGIRYIPVPLVMERLDYLIDKYNVGFIEPQIEAFATNQKWLLEFCEEIKKRDVLWHAGAVRAKSVSNETLRSMKDAGCVSVTYGLETGSDKMLGIMEKKTTMSDNYNAQKWTIDNEMYDTVIQLVVGMPGENKNTIQDTISFSKYALTLSDKINPLNISINFVQALPGTPLYEYGRHIGLIGRSVDEEESYLISISNQDASNPLSTINFTEYPMAILWSWKLQILSGVIWSYVKKYGLKHTIRICDEKMSGNEGLINNPKVTNNTIFLVVSLYCMKYVSIFLPAFALIAKYKKIGVRAALKLSVEYGSYIFRKNPKARSHNFNKSLRKIVNEECDEIKTDLVQMKPLRKGR